MKTKNILLLIAMAAATILTGCQPEAPFDTQSPNDAPIILTPYNESGTGTFTYDLLNPDTPLYDSVTVTPSKYTTINWYLDQELVYTGVKIDMCFPAGTYALTIEAVTEAGLRTERTGTVTVHPYDYDPYSAAPAAGRHLAPGVETQIDGQNLSKAKNVIISTDIFGLEVVHTITLTYQEDGFLKFILPDTEDGTYFLRLQDENGKIYGADNIHVHNGAVALAGFAEMPAGSEWVITGVNLQKVAKVKVADIEITDLQVTDNSVTLTAPALEVGEYALSMFNEDGSAVLFITNEGAVEQAKTVVPSETTIWTGAVTIDWNADLVKVDAAAMAAVPVGATIYVYFEVPAAEYHAMRVITPWWDYDFLPQVDGMENQPNPYSFPYTAEGKEAVDRTGAMSVVGFGLTVTKITFK
jgi:hypothetical protein